MRRLRYTESGAKRLPFELKAIEVTVEPRVEDLLATIRKAIDEDMGGLSPPSSSTSGNSKGTLLRGALREMRVNYDPKPVDAKHADREIAELRERIVRSRSSSFPAVPAAPVAIPPRFVPRQGLKPGGVGSILAGEVDNQRGYPPEPVLRPSYDVYPEEQQPATYDEPTWAEEPQQADYYQPQPAYQAPAPVPIVSQRTAYQTQASFQNLAENLLSRATGERGVEDMTRELLRGLLKQWLDDNLPQLVERLVREEIERVARRGR